MRGQTYGFAIQTAEPLILDCATEIEFAETGIFWITPIIRGRMGENIVSTTNQRPVVVKGQFAQLARNMALVLIGDLGVHRSSDPGTAAAAICNTF